MKKIVLILFIQCLALSIYAQVHCGTERWDVKTLSDPDTVKINFNQVVPSSVHEQVLIVPPGKIKHDLPRRDDESIIYHIKCNIISFKREGGSKGDKDIHVVIQDPETFETMIAEIPHPVCNGIQGTSRVQQFEDLNQWFSDNIGEPTTKFKELMEPASVVITGLGFFDFNHGQRGRATNGREIHPVLSIEFVQQASPIASLTNSETNINNNLNISNMETTATPLSVLIMILLGAILGGAGQGIRVIVGLKKVYDEANKENRLVGQLIEYKQIVLSLFIGFSVGAIAGVLAAVSSMDAEFSKSMIIAFITAGYAGTDFIEGFMKKNTISKP
jgi:hypothetical protein